MSETNAREKPVLFSGAMVRAILEGKKTQTRRVVKGQECGAQEEMFLPEHLCGPEFYEPVCVDKNGDEYPGKEIYGAYCPDGAYGFKCPYQPGDILWVREPAKLFADKRGIGWVSGIVDDEVQVVYLADGECSGWLPYPSRARNSGGRQRITEWLLPRSSPPLPGSNERPRRASAGDKRR